MKKLIERYRNLITPVLWEYESVKINSYIPEITDFHYRRGFINRYFIRRVNDSNGVVFEVDVSEFSKFANNPRFSTVQLVWRISGDSHEKIKEFNRNSIMDARRKISNIHLYLVNLDQFYKEIDF